MEGAQEAVVGGAAQGTPRRAPLWSCEPAGGRDGQALAPG